MKNNIQIEKIGQIAIAVSDLDRSVEFYRDILGLEFLFDAPPALAFFTCGGVRLMLTTLQGDERDHHTSAIYYQVADINAATTTLQ
ncbi:MAG: VOC family protein, partial [Gammaproteobacteria bacterium]|nr:VOC family protein [Gammaproteobacteria bacterium]